jgi:V/A-type H+-transporting ATPase subunit C
LEAVLASMIPGGGNLDKTIITELYSAQNVTSALQGLVKSRYPGLSAFVSSDASDATSRLLFIQQMLNEIMKHEVQRILIGYPFTIGIILAYFILKRDELKKIRIILNTKQYGVQQERIESMI